MPETQEGIMEAEGTHHVLSTDPEKLPRARVSKAATHAQIQELRTWGLQRPEL